MGDRIDTNPEICHGQPCIKGTRVIVYTIIELLESDLTPDEIIKDYYPKLTKDDIKECLHYAASLIKDQEYVPLDAFVG